MYVLKTSRANFKKQKQSSNDGVREQIWFIRPRGVKRLHCTRGKSQVLAFEPEVFRKQMYCVEESTCDIVGTSRSDSAPPKWFDAGGLCPPCPLVTSLIRSTGDLRDFLQGHQDSAKLNWFRFDNVWFS